MKFSYTAFDKSGKPASASLDAANPDEARDLLRRQSLFVTDLRAADDPSVTPPAPTPAARVESAPARVSTARRLKFLTTFARQLHVLISSGTPIVQALAAIERQTEQPHLRKIVATLRDRVETGVPLSDAM